MSPRNKVPDLRHFCLTVVSNLLIENLSDDESDNYGDICSYISNATFEIIQDLLETILNTEYLDAATRYRCLEILLRSDVKKLETGMFPHLYYEGILKTITEKGKGIQYLNLKGVWVRDHPQLLCELIEQLKNLKVLIIPHMPDDSVLESVTSLNYLNVLDISGECSFTGDGLKLLNNSTITVLEIGSFGKQNICQHKMNDCEIVANIIENLPNLLYLRTYSFVGGALDLLNKKYPNFKTKLKYIRDTGTTPNIIQVMIDLCPTLESLYLDSPELGVVNKLHNFKKLNCLKLIKPEMSELNEFLKNAGQRIHILKLSHNKTNSLDLSDVCLNVPNLTTLECFHMSVIFTQNDTYFMNLQNVEILYCDISDHCLRFILLNAPFLCKIVVGCKINMTDGDIFRLCAESEFLCLEELWFSLAKNLTVTSVELLMGHCPNLKVIGRLNGWDISYDDWDYLKGVITFTNTDLNILYS